MNICTILSLKQIKPEIKGIVLETKWIKIDMITYTLPVVTVRKTIVAMLHVWKENFKSRRLT